MEAKAKQETADTVKSCDANVAAMVETLDQYKRQNEKDLEAKNHEIAEAKNSRDLESNKVFLKLIDEFLFHSHTHTTCM